MLVNIVASDVREYVNRFAADMMVTVADHALDVDTGRRKELCQKLATLGLMARRANHDVWPDGFDSGRRFTVERTEPTENGDTVSIERLNPASRVSHTPQPREREILEELCLWAGFREA